MMVETTFSRGWEPRCSRGGVVSWPSTISTVTRPWAYLRGERACGSGGGEGRQPARRHAHQSDMLASARLKLASCSAVRRVGLRAAPPLAALAPLPAHRRARAL